MKIALLLVAVLLAASPSATAEELQAPLIVETPPEWTVEFKGDKGIACYTLEKPPRGTALLMLIRLPVPLAKGEIPRHITTMAEGILKTFKMNPAIKLESDDYVRENIGGTEFTGESAFFTIGDGHIQTMFLISSGDEMWSGQFTGSKEGWAEALEILKKLKVRS